MTSLVIFYRKYSESGNKDDYLYKSETEFNAYILVSLLISIKYHAYGSIQLTIDDIVDIMENEVTGNIMTKLHILNYVYS